jgi:hypothetical protein
MLRLKPKTNPHLDIVHHYLDIVHHFRRQPIKNSLTTKSVKGRRASRSHP